MDDPLRKMTGQKIIQSTVYLNQSCLLKEEQEQVYNLLVRYRGTFSLTAHGQILKSIYRL